MFTLNATLKGSVIGPSRHESLEEVGDALSRALEDNGLGLPARAVVAILQLIQADLQEHLWWNWSSDRISIRVTRD